MRDTRYEIRTTSHAASPTQREKERGPFSRFAESPDPTAVAVNDSLDGRETDPRSRKLLHFVKTLKGVEDLADIFHVEARSVIPDKKHGFTV